MAEALIYTLRPDGTSLWLTSWVASSLGITNGQRLTLEQYDSADIQEMIKARRTEKR